MSEPHQILITELPSRGVRAGLRVNAYPERGVIDVRDVAIHIGIDRGEAVALAAALTEAVEVLDRNA